MPSTKNLLLCLIRQYGKATNATKMANTMSLFLLFIFFSVTSQVQQNRQKQILLSFEFA